MAGVSTKEIANRIRSMESTKQITKAMEMVAASKLRRAQAQVLNSRPYFEILYSTINDIVESNRDFSSPYFANRETKRTLFIVIAGDRGLAGGYNSNLFRLLESEATDPHAVFLPIGKRARDYCHRRGLATVWDDELSSEKLTDSQLTAISDLLCDGFRDHRFDAVKLIHTKLHSVLSQEAVCSPLLPLPVAEKAANTVTIYEPDPETLMNRAVSDYLTAAIGAAVRESFLCELYARRSAMDSASQNAEEMIDSLSLQYNRARQSSITQEITEIVAGAEGQQ